MKSLQLTINHFSFILLLQTFSISIGLSQNWSPPLQWGSSGNETCDALAISSDGSIFLAGTFLSDVQIGDQTLETRGEEDIFFLRTNASGDVRWAKRAGSRLGDEVAAIATDSEGNLVGAGSFWFDADFEATELTATQNPKAIFMVKYSADGQLQWAQAINGTNLKEVEALAIDANDDILITGFFSDSIRIADTTLVAAGDTDLFVAKFTAAGELRWALQQGQSGDTRGSTLGLTSTGDAIVSGFFNDTAIVAGERLIANTDDRDLFLTRISATGEPLWARKAGGVFDKDPTALAVDDADNIYITGFLIGVMTLSPDLSIQSQTGTPDFFIVKYDAAGNPLAARAFGGTLPQEPTDILVQDNTVLLSGFYQGAMAFDGFSFDAGFGVHSFLLGFDANLLTLWAKDIAADNAIFAMQIIEDADANLWASGSFQGMATFDNQTINADSYDIFLAKLNQEATSTAAPKGREQRFLAFPNPAREVLLIQTDIANYTVQLLDSTGREVFRAVNPKTIGVQRFQNGMYFLRFKYDNQTEVQRILVSRKE